MYQRILCPVDGSPTSDRGLAEAIALARDQGAALRLMHVVDLHWLALDGGAGMASAELIDAMRAGGESILEDARRRAQDAGLAVDAVLLESPAAPASDLVVEQAAAWPADLVVIGTHGRRGAQRLVMGSDAERVVRACSVPVLLVRAPQAPGGAAAAAVGSGATTVGAGAATAVSGSAIVGSGSAAVGAAGLAAPGDGGGAV